MTEDKQTAELLKALGQLAAEQEKTVALRAALEAVLADIKQIEQWTANPTDRNKLRPHIKAITELLEETKDA